MVKKKDLVNKRTIQTDYKSQLHGIVNKKGINDNSSLIAMCRS